MSPEIAWILILGTLTIGYLSAFLVRARINARSWDPAEQGQVVDDALRRPYPVRD